MKNLTNVQRTDVPAGAFERPADYTKPGDPAGTAAAAASAAHP